MDLEKLLELMFNNPNNISIEYSNINGKEKLIVNGKDLSEKEEEFDDSEIKNRIGQYKANIEDLDDYIFELVIEEAERRDYDLEKMNNVLELESFTEEQAQEADTVMELMSDLVKDVIKDRIDHFADLFKQW